MEFERVVEGDGRDWRSLLGRKVSIRYRIRNEPGLPSSSEAIGVVMGVRDEDRSQMVKIINKRGEVKEVSAEDVVAGKIWPV